MKSSVSFAIVFVSVLIAQSFASLEKLPEEAQLTRTTDDSEITVKKNAQYTSITYNIWIAKYPAKDGPECQVCKSVNAFSGHRYRVTLNGVTYWVEPALLKLEVYKNDFFPFC